MAIAGSSPFASTMWTALFIMGLPVLIVWRRAQSVSQTSARNISLHFWPRAFLRGIPVISSAARLNEVMHQSKSTVKTPSVIESRITSRSLLCALFCITYLYHTIMIFTTPNIHATTRLGSPAEVVKRRFLLRRSKMGNYA